MRGIDAVFYRVLELISGPGQTLHDVIAPTQTILSHGLLGC